MYQPRHWQRQQQQQRRRTAAVGADNRHGVVGGRQIAAIPAPSTDKKTPLQAPAAAAAAAAAYMWRRSALQPYRTLWSARRAAQLRAAPSCSSSCSRSRSRSRSLMLMSSDAVPCVADVLSSGPVSAPGQPVGRVKSSIWPINCVMQLDPRVSGSYVVRTTCSASNYLSLYWSLPVARGGWSSESTAWYRACSRRQQTSQSVSTTNDNLRPCSHSHCCMDLRHIVERWISLPRNTPTLTRQRRLSDITTVALQYIVKSKTCQDFVLHSLFTLHPE